MFPRNKCEVRVRCVASWRADLAYLHMLQYTACLAHDRLISCELSISLEGKADVVCAQAQVSTAS